MQLTNCRYTHFLAVRNTALSSYYLVVLWLAVSIQTDTIVSQNEGNTTTINFQINNDSFSVSDAAPNPPQGEHILE